MLIRRKDGEWGVIYSVLCKSTLYVHPDEHTSEPLLSINLQSEASSLPSSAPGSGHNSLTHKLNFSTSPGGSRPSSPDSTMTGSPRDGVSGPQMSIRLVDDSLFGVENCFCIEAQSSRYSDRLFDADSMPESRHLTKYYFVVESVKERHHWIEELRAAMLTSQSLRHVTSLELGVNALHVDRNSSAAAQLLPSGKGASSNMYYCNIHFDNELQARTFSKRDNEGVVEWMAQFHFDDIRHSFFDMSIVIWRMGTSAKEKDVEIGRITMPFHTLAQTTLNKENVGAGGNWYQLESGIGKVRIELRYTVERICPLPTYNSLFVFLLNTLNADTNMVNLIYDALNGDSTAQAKSEFAGSLVRFFLGIGQITKFLRTLTRCEIFATDQPTIIFRGNTMATKAMDQFMKICCEDYLHETMDEVAYDMFSCTQSCEIDPTQMDKGEDLMKNWRRLKSFIDRVTKSVFESSATVPRDLVVIFEGIRVAMADKFGDADQNKGLTAISGFIFLRLFSAALQGPHLHPFLLVPDIPEERSRRLFTLVSKTVQTLANLRLFSQKEEHLMNMMNNSFEEDHVLDKMRKFLTEVSTVYYGPKTASDIDKTMALYDAPIDIAAIVPMLKHSSVFVTFPPNHGPTISSTVHPAASAGVGVRVDIERELAFINHHLQKKRPYLAKKAESNAVLKPLITKLFAIIDDVQKNEQTVIDNAQRQGFQVSTGEAADE
ncbi:hypothetical protein CAOG_08849 [Capsaspora owczarzaki ATCC 30864]|uniref:Ras-GAP domain-containing protein n=1 Tax=Capsaspora owczarzaki (strain ATCC 30864) TaxID=595528 RepID=A0A0D2WSC6_CAPO3|nr:hypothetical protein CAOG_08849 [Capsaspora owczarzaki ATCC 30864]KJE94328.1 hypothetical protein CAOG_008849 [Capsaspora owczarzaki ATCC 30864]|eukprot:XP_011270503.1 hypothetical protein CAOG_08849 [Capsaspora owczarzaki ATCC 30864]